MIYRNFIAPSRAFSQFSHEIIRHPRLDSHAARLLTWQLSLPTHARETLSETAKRARIGATSFTTAKRQLKAEGYVHERRTQVSGGLWVTQQLVSSAPLRPEEAAKIFAGMPAHSGVERVYAQVAPGSPVPAVGHPETRSTDGHPEKDRRANTSDLPPGAADSGRGPGDDEHVLHGLPGAGTPVQRPGGLVRYLLREVPPRALPRPEPSPPRSGSRLSSRLEGARECASGAHTQPMLFRPVADEVLCSECLGLASQGGPGV
ncbi:hypothetical protein ACIP8Z_20125 [Streptomyces sp. NPDC088553]|uniref:hypothetical protein n=1 Tax=Streptomyces sp. NPDC088553 TaxID=3365864 RepID=UPI0037F5555C